MKKERFYYCPSCGEINLFCNCSHCNDKIWSKGRIEPVESLHAYEYYITEAEKRFGDPSRWKEVFETDELFNNPQFSIEKYNTVRKHHLYLCPVCAKHHNKFSSREEITCTVCGHQIKLYESKHDLGYYHIKSMVLFGDFKHNRNIIVDEELSGTPLFNREEASKITVDNQYSAEFQYHTTNAQNPNVPKCPTCQSTNIKKISSTKRAAHGFMFGIFSKTAFSQFECENCGYKW